MSCSKAFRRFDRPGDGRWADCDGIRAMDEMDFMDGMDDMAPALQVIQTHATVMSMFFA